MQRDLYFANNFGLYQGASGDAESTYLHDGLDIVMPNGTPIHAVEAGIVRYVDARVENYKSVFVEDADERGAGGGTRTSTASP
jgi:murein DD-endopeptidase MepM/ murein hydrolase activator NlpD